MNPKSRTFLSTSKKSTYLHKIKKGGLFALFGLMALVVTFSTIPASQALAVSATDSPTIRAKSWAYLNALTWCVREGLDSASGTTKISDSDARAGQWWQQEDGLLGFLDPRVATAASYLHANTDNEGRVACNDILEEAASIWGFGTNYLEILCGFQPTRDDGSPCVDGRDEFDLWEINDKWEAFNSFIIDEVYDGSAPALTADMDYVFALNAFRSDEGCGARPSTVSGNPENFVYKDMVIIENDGSQSPPTEYTGEARDKRVKMYVGNDFNNYNVFEITCAEVADIINDSATRYLAWFAQNPDKIDSEVTDEDCNPDNPDRPESCDETPTESSCQVDGLGWLVCPALTFMATLTDEAFKLIETFLVVDTALLSTSSGTYDFWEGMRNFANVAFIIVFLIIIFSQLTSLGVNNYGVKKTLPRLIIAAILVNISFFICQLAVDLSNITGASLYSALTSIPTGNEGGGDASGNALGWFAVITSALAVGTGAILAISIPVLLAALLAVAVILLILMTRFALIVILTGLAPLAFVAFLLPNTEHLFKKWLKLFTSMLVLYPVVAVVFGASYIASRVIIDAGAELAAGDIMQGSFLQITGLAVAALPLLAVPSILKGSLNAAGTIGTKLGNLSSKANGRIGSKVKSTSRLGETQRAIGQRFAQGRAKTRTRVFGKLDQSRVGRAMGWNKGAALAGEVSRKADAEEVTAMESQMRQRSVSEPDHAAKQLESALKSGDTVAAKAAQNVLYSQGTSGVDKFNSIITSVGSDAKDSASHAVRENILQNHGQMIKGKSADTITWAASGGKRSLADISADPRTWSKLSPAELATQSAEALKRAEATLATDPTAAAAFANTAKALHDNDQLRDSLNPDQLAVINRTKAP